MKTLLSRAALAAAAMALGLSGAHATTTTATLTAKLTVLQACSVSADTFLDFGEKFASVGGTSDATAKVHVSCSSGTMTLFLTSSNACSGGGRCMKSDVNSVKYDLFTASGADPANLWPASQSVSSGDVTIYGRAYLTGAAAGAYTDTVTVSLQY